MKQKERSKTLRRTCKRGRIKRGRWKGSKGERGGVIKGRSKGRGRTGKEEIYRVCKGERRRKKDGKEE